MKSYHVYFICQHTCTAVDAPIKISVTRNWVIRAAPVLKLGLMALKMAAVSCGLPFPVPNMPLQEQLSVNEEFVMSLLEDTHQKLLLDLEKSISQQAMDHAETAQIRPLVGDAYEAIAEKALKPKNSQWKECMSPVVSMSGRPIWIKNEYLGFY